MARQVDILMHANEYLRKLDEGIDPLSGKKLPHFSAAWEDDVRKLLYFCSKNLVNIINFDNTDTRPAFSITPEQAARLRPADGSVGLSELTNRINRAVDTLECRGISRFMLSAWLGGEGYLRREGNGNLYPAKQGSAIGITSDGKGAVTFDRNAQQFVIDHVQELAAFAREKAGDGTHYKAKIKDTRLIQGNIAGLRRLSGGRHPYKDAPLDEQDPLAQERLKKCFEYTAQALERSAEAGYFTAKAPFTLPRELWGEIAIRQEPVSLTEFIRRVNALLPDPTAVKGLAAATARSYLISKGLLELAADDGGKRRTLPTPAGNELGIGKEKAMNENGEPYTGAVYNAAAQRYLVEHLDEIIEFAAGKK